MRLLFIFSFAFINIVAQCQNFNLQKCIDYALQNRIELKKSHNYIVLSQQNVIYSKYNLLPSINIETGHQYNKAKDFSENNGNYSSYQIGNYSLNSQLVIFNGMQTILKIKQNILLNEMSITELEIIEQDIKREVIYAYYELLLAIENNRIILYSLENISKQIQIIQEMVSQGKISVIDLYEIKARYKSVHSNLLQTEINIKKANVLLKKAMNFPLDSIFEIDIIKDNTKLTMNDLNIKDYCNKILETSPQIQRAIQDSIFHKENLSIIKSHYYPYLTTNASLYSSYSDVAVSSSGGINYNFNNQFKDNFAYQVGFSLVIPLYSRHSIKQKIFENGIKLENSILDKQIIKNKIYRDIEILIETIEVQKKKIHSRNEEVNLYTEIYEMRTKQYKSGKLSITDYLISENKKINAELELNLENYTLLLNISVFELYLGTI
ncbi:MAG: TolC family protein [Bacteroidales bacterium]|nr:TolC family protein [Bacteroidales bacterium]NLK82014.1 TolC family protein [Bacteroidales bacterium]